MYHSFLIHLSANGNLGSFHDLATVNSATLENMCLFQFWFSWCVCTAVGMLGGMVVLFPVFNRISTLFSIMVVLVCIPTNSVRGSLFSTPSPAFIVCRLFDGSHSDWCEMVPYCLYLHFTDSE